MSTDTTENIWVVPGNHDVDRTVSAKSKVTRALQKALQATSQLPRFSTPCKSEIST